MYVEYFVIARLLVGGLGVFRRHDVFTRDQRVIIHSRTLVRAGSGARRAAYLRISFSDSIATSAK